MKKDKLNKSISKQQRYSDSLKLKLIYQKDSTYHGFIDSSYQRQGMGILLNSNFCLAVGYWHRNKLQGPALLLYPHGIMIFGSFKNSQLLGPILIDTQQQLFCGTFDGKHMNGNVIHHNREDKTWKILVYFQGVPIQVVDQFHADQKDGLGRIVKVDPHITEFIQKHNQKKWFKLINIANQQLIASFSSGNKYQFYQNNGHEFRFGFQGDAAHERIEAIYNIQTMQALRIGVTKNTRQIGYTLSHQEKSKLLLIGFYQEGYKEGTFLAMSQDFNELHTYRRGTLISINSAASLKQFKQAKHKLYEGFILWNYQSKEYLQKSSGINFNNLLKCFKLPNLTFQFKESVKVQATSTKKIMPLTPRPQNHPGDNQSHVPPSEVKSSDLLRQKLMILSSSMIQSSHPQQTTVKDDTPIDDTDESPFPQGAYMKSFQPNFIRKVSLQKQSLLNWF